MLSGLGETHGQLLFALWQEMVSSMVTVYLEVAETIRYVAIVKRKVLMFISQSTQLKFSNLNGVNFHG